MARMRTIKSAYEEIHKADPGTCLTEYRLRQLVIEGDIKSIKAGNKYLIDMDSLENYCKGA